MLKLNPGSVQSHLQVITDFGTEYIHNRSMCKSMMQKKISNGIKQMGASVR